MINENVSEECVQSDSEFSNSDVNTNAEKFKQSKWMNDYDISIRTDVLTKNHNQYKKPWIVSLKI